MKTQDKLRLAVVSLGLACVIGMAACQVDFLDSYEEQATSQGQKIPPSSKPVEGNDLVIETTSLPSSYPHGRYFVMMRSRGGIPPWHWRVRSGELPLGLKLEDDGTLHGEPEKVGEYRFTISLSDNSKSPGVQREFVLNVTAALALVWKTPAHVAGNRIEGSVEVSNATPEDFDLTFIVLAVNENGRATAIGYQRFPLKKGTTDFEIPFGDTVPHGAYVVHVDAVGEVAKQNQIHRARLQTPGALQVAVGP